MLHHVHVHVQQHVHVVVVHVTVVVMRRMRTMCRTQLTLPSAPWRTGRFHESNAHSVLHPTFSAPEVSQMYGPGSSYDNLLPGLNMISTATFAKEGLQRQLRALPHQR